MFELELQLLDNEIDELVEDFAFQSYTTLEERTIFINKYRYYRRLYELYIHAKDENMEELNWQQLHEKGFCCLRDYEMFPFLTQFKEEVFQKQKERIQQYENKK